MNYTILTAVPTKDYALLDSGDGEKLERFGDVILSRPDPQALWPKNQPQLWQKAGAVFARTEKAVWQTKASLPDRWSIQYADLTFWIRLSAFKHTGIFPEHAPNWAWIMERVKGAQKPVRVLNLFGYTGGASLAAAKAGAEVVHLDGSKVAIQWAKDNAEQSGLGDAPIRYILDDAMSFVKREIRRGRKYEGIILDPPAFGHGPNKEVWKIEEHFVELLTLCRELLADKPVFFLANGYASGYSALAYKQNLDFLTERFGGTTTFGELTIAEESTNRVLPCGIFARWEQS